ncbi:hypothetical protein CPB83DRAFT_901659 [Crepidotus variabilis]|uniref:F-box domain-containing protein n=1 Tax=Crepidotus variabilis TaxID=179855 RepID=A0A9P6ETF4_9AGAR|nr:hypothetical protein CPB83DRAFT_901659 [Crepidotus variabilis]
MIISLETLPVDLLAVILGELDLDSLIRITYLSKRLYTVSSDESLNPWRNPIRHNLHSNTYEKSLTHLSVRRVVPRQNWIDIISTARPSFILYEATLPNLSASEWEECFRRRFLPSWQKWRKESTWKEAFLKLLHRVWHRSTTSCTADESWTKYIVLNRNGSANELESSSRSFNPFTIFDNIKLQCNMHHLRSVYQPILELPDVRIAILGTVDRPRTSFPVNSNAHILVNPPGIYSDLKGSDLISKSKSLTSPVRGPGDYGVYPKSAAAVPTFLYEEYKHPSANYSHLTHPQPTQAFARYPFFTPGGGDARWSSYEYMLEEGLHWVGGMMIFAQIRIQTSEGDDLAFKKHPSASFSWTDLWAIAPWMEDRISKKITGAGLGN